MSFSYNKKKIQVIFKPSDLNIIIQANTDKLARVFINIIENSISFSLQRSNILIFQTKVKENVIIYIADQGTGINREVKDKIFTRFYTDRSDKFDYSEETIVVKGVKDTIATPIDNKAILKLLDKDERKGKKFTLDKNIELEWVDRMGKVVFKSLVRLEPNAISERVKTVRETVGDKIDIMVDANCAYNLNQAIKIADKIEKYDIFWFEEPLLPDDYDGYKILSSKSSIPIATGENEYTKFGFKELIEKNGATIIQPDALIMGGATEFMKVASFAETHHLEIAPHGNQNVHIQLLCAIPNGLILEYYVGTTDPLWGQIYQNDLKLKNGMVSPPDVPGLGLEIKEKNLEKYRVI